MRREREIFRRFQEETGNRRPYRNAIVRMRKSVPTRVRVKALRQAGLNVFLYPAARVDGCDLLSDSGTGAMTTAQWAELIEGDESYGSNEGYFLLREQLVRTFGEAWRQKDPRRPNLFIFHQGRAAEHALFTIIGKTGNNLIIPSNGHFDTTGANIEANAITAVNLFSKELKQRRDHPFKGDMDVGRLRTLLSEKKQKKQIPLVFLTITNNTGGGQPVSMANIRQVSRISHRNDIPLFFDACRFAENAYFIKQRERGYAKKSIPAIVREMFSHVDGFTVSWKKDGLSNMGGSIVLRPGGLFMKRYPELLEQITDHQILTEGHPTYGGLTGRDLKALARGIATITDEGYLAHRVGQVARFGERLQRAGVPVLTPFGGHAVYLDMNRFFEGTGLAREDYPGIAFTALLLGSYGHRLCELGDFAFGREKDGKQEFPEVNYVRAAIPRLVYEDQDLAACADAIISLYRRREKIPGVVVTYGRDKTLRHFKAQFRLRT
ncbi:MAG: tryptophanase [DPANN group archaeon]|nr:tryptophanase [DPANN group archaeon]